MKHYLFALAVWAMVLLASCSGEEELAYHSSLADNVVRVTANVNEIGTRASYTNSTLTEFGISIQNAKNEKYCYGNNKVTKLGNLWNPATQMLWENKDQEVNIYAYAPYNSSYTGNIYAATAFPVSVSTDQTSATDQSDFLLCKASGFKPSEDLQNGNVPIVFNHALSQLKINITFCGNEFNTSFAVNPIIKVYVTGTKVNAVCNFATQSITAVKTASFVIAQEMSFTAATENSAAEATYSCILIPQTIVANEFQIQILTHNDKMYTWTSTQAVTLEQGKWHQLDLTVGKDKVSVVDVTVKDWEASSATISGKCSVAE